MYEVWTSRKDTSVAKTETKNKQVQQAETIVAIATGAGTGGIAVVRISGKTAFAVAEAILCENSGAPLQQKAQTDRTMRLVQLSTQGIRDRVLCVFFYAPHSYTGEDVAEIHTHGNNEIAAAAVRGAIAAGARQAEAGEFTRRAFLNGKIDLTAAEGLGDLIEAQGEEQLRAAYAQSEGVLKKAIEAIETELTELAAMAEAAIDYPEEDLEEITNEQIGKRLQTIRAKVQALQAGYTGGAMLREGVHVVLCGDANVGKSSLLNALLGNERAIVTAKAGTTRDTIEETLVLGGIKFVLCDTAGLRQTDDEAEQKGVERSRRAIESADLVLAVSAPAQPFTEPLPEKPCVLRVANKSDLYETEAPYGDGALCVSARTGEGIEALKKAMVAAVQGKVSGTGARVNNLRQYSAVTAAAAHIDRAERNYKQLPPDLLADDLKAAAQELGKITGRVASAEVVDAIFKKFCVGK